LSFAIVSPLQVIRDEIVPSCRKHAGFLGNEEKEESRAPPSGARKTTDLRREPVRRTQSQDQEEEEKDPEDQRENLGDRERSARDARETQDGRDETDEEKRQGEFQHFAPPRVGNCESHARAGKPAQMWRGIA
jgi:hypothetical protein